MNLRRPRSTGSPAPATLDWLDRNRNSSLVEGAVAVVNAVRPRSQFELDRVVEHIGQHCR